MQDAEGFAVIWRNAQRARSELLSTPAPPPAPR